MPQSLIKTLRFLGYTGTIAVFSFLSFIFSSNTKNVAGTENVLEHFSPPRAIADVPYAEGAYYAEGGYTPPDQGDMDDGCDGDDGTGGGGDDGCGGS